MVKNTFVVEVTFQKKPHCQLPLSFFQCLCRERTTHAIYYKCRGAEKKIITAKKFLHTIKPFLTNNACTFNDFIGVEKDCNLISTKQQLVELFNEHNINLLEKSSGKKPLSLRNSSDPS